MVKEVQHFQSYLYGIHFTVQTDHAALKWLLNSREPEGQVARWIQLLQEYNFKIQHWAGSRHLNADLCPDGYRHCKWREVKAENAMSQTSQRTQFSSVTHDFGQNLTITRQAFQITRSGTVNSTKLSSS